MNSYKISKLKDFLEKVVNDNLPNKKDNIRQLIIKITFLFCIVGVICVGTHFSVYYSNSAHQQKLIEEQQQLFHKADMKLKHHRFLQQLKRIV